MMTFAFVLVIIFYYFKCKNVYIPWRTSHFGTNLFQYIHINVPLYTFGSCYTHKSHASLETAFSIYPHHVTTDKIVEHTVFRINAA